MRIGRSIHAQTVEKIASWITQRRYKAGENLPIEAAIGAELGVSRTVVREAVKTLAAKGLVTTGPRIGTRVRPVSTWNLFDHGVIAWRLAAGVDEAFVNDLIELRLAIEPVAAAGAAARADDVHRAEVADRIQLLAEAVEGRGEYLEADLAFHTAILMAAGNQFFVSLAPILGSVLKVSFMLSVTSREAIRASLPLHRAVADAILQRRPEAASQALRTLIEQARHDIAAGFQPGCIPSRTLTGIREVA